MNSFETSNKNAYSHTLESSQLAVPEKSHADIFPVCEVSRPDQSAPPPGLFLRPGKAQPGGKRGQSKLGSRRQREQTANPIFDLSLGCKARDRDQNFSSAELPLKIQVTDLPPQNLHCLANACAGNRHS